MLLIPLPHTPTTFTVISKQEPQDESAVHEWQPITIYASTFTIVGEWLVWLGRTWERVVW